VFNNQPVRPLECFQHQGVFLQAEVEVEEKETISVEVTEHGKYDEITVAQTHPGASMTVLAKL
jgi:hypothetical protein